MPHKTAKATPHVLYASMRRQPRTTLEEKIGGHRSSEISLQIHIFINLYTVYISKTAKIALSYKKEKFT